MMKIIPPLAEHTTQAGAWRRGIVAAIEKMLPLCARLSSGQEKYGSSKANISEHIKHIFCCLFEKFTR